MKKRIFILTLLALAGAWFHRAAAQSGNCDVTLSVSGILSCNGPAVTITATALPANSNYLYFWAGPGPNIGNSSQITVSQPGTYAVFVSDSTSFCSDTITVLSDGSIPDAFITSSAVVCNEVTFTAQTNDPQNTFLWSNGITNPAIQVDQTATYCVTVTSPAGCTATDCRSFFVGNLLEIEIQHFGSNNLCTDSLGLFVSISGGVQPYAYAWSNGSTWSWLQPSGAGWYAVTVTDANGCSATDSYYFDYDLDDCGTIQGKVFADFNNNCLFNSGDQGLQQFTVRIEDAAGATYYAYTDQSGNYSVSFPSGTYTVGVVLNNSAWTPCQPTYSVNVPFGATVTRDLALQADVLCPALQVDVAANFLRRCIGDNYYHVSYCNQGTATAEDAYLELTLDPFLNFLSASIPATALGNNRFRFDLGDVAVTACGSFWIRVQVDCAAELGQTHCVEAVIFPHDPCPPADPQWSGASVRLRAECLGSELVFRAQNVGTAPMTANLNYVIIEDAVMLMSNPGDPLGQGEDRLLFTAPANGATWRIEANQEPFHPGASQPSLSVEGCATGQNFSLGFVNQFESDDADLWKDIDCRENVGSYDPNDKQGFPRGYGAQHYIKPGVDIEYLIRFQNTGTDTAFQVVIRDTLSPWLDPGSVAPGASSHPYRFDYYGDGYLKFVFDPIALPDSNVNQAGSQGFVSFRVKQRADVPLETDIFNQAAIYFDANPPVITNKTQHRVGESFVTVSAWSPGLPGLQLSIQPNPAVTYALLQLQGLPADAEWQVELLDGLGRPVLREQAVGSSWRLERGALPSGLYLLRVLRDGKLLGTGKVVLR